MSTWSPFYLYLIFNLAEMSVVTHRIDGRFDTVWQMRLSLSILALASSAFAQNTDWTLEFANHYNVVPNITYLTANNYEAKLDLYERRDVQEVQPTLIYIHGGGWTGGTKEGGFNKVLPYLEMGWNVVNVEYRLARVSLAPAAVEDCLCALRWIGANAKQRHIDINRLVVTGDSSRRPSRAHYRHDSRERRTRSRVSGSAAAESRRHRRLVRHYRCQRSSRRNESEDLRRGVAQQHARPAGDSEARFAA